VKAASSASCPTCGSAVPAGARVCPVCRVPLPDLVAPSARPEPAGPPEDGSAGARLPDNPFATELNRRLARLAQWSESAEPLGVELPRLPTWAEEAASRSRTPEPWAEVVRGVERLAQRRISEAFDKWEQRTSSRIGRLEAYSVESRLERSQIEDAVHAAKLGDIAQALATFQQVDRVVTLKERHLDQAREELERLVGFLRDLEALGLMETGESAEVAQELERELRTGHLAALKQRLRSLRARAVDRVSESFVDYVSRLGDQLLADRSTGPEHDAEARELAIAARAIALGRPEEGIRRLRALKEATGLEVPVSAARPAPRG